MIRRYVLFVAVLFAGTAFAQTSALKTETIRGWLSDEHCSRSKARDGKYTAPNPDCAKECVAKGGKIVLVDPTQKRVLLLTNQARAMKNLGDYVEVTGEVDAEAQTIRCDSIKFLEKVPSPNANPKS